MSKGSARRPSDVDAESFAERWERTFGKDAWQIQAIDSGVIESAPAGYAWRWRGPGDFESVEWNMFSPGESQRGAP